MKIRQHPEHLLVIKNLRVRTKSSLILKGITISIKSREIHVIMGPNGSGKSTFLYALMGHPEYRISRGSIFLDGKNIKEKKPHERARAGLFLAFQHPHEFVGLPFANVVRSAKNSKLKYSEPDSKGIDPTECVARMKDHMSAIGLNSQFLYRSLNEGFSGGEKKKAEIVQMMMLQPTFAFLDEIDSGLDVDAIGNVCASIQRAVEEYGTGVILVTHNPSILSSIDPDHVHIMAKGDIVASGGKELINTIHQGGYESFIKKHIR